MLSKSNVPTTNFTTPGFKISLSGTSQASQTHSGGSRHLLESVIYNYLLYGSQRPLYNLNAGHFQRDNILYENFENYAYYNQPTEKISPLLKMGVSYTTNSGEWTFEISSRRKNYTGQYVLGNDKPFEYYPGKLNYNWRESQYNVIRNHAITDFFMIQPLIGIRELREDYSRISDIGSYPFGKRQSSLQEQSHTYSQQAGLSFYFKIFESLRFKATGKLFQAINGKLQLVRNDTQQVASDYYITNFQSKTNHVKSRGNEIEGEFSYSLKKINFFLGYNLTTTYREANRDSNFIPTIVTNGNLQTEYIRFFYSEFLSERNLSANDGASYKPRVQILKHFYFGVSINF